jgi:hypothetical protein
MEQEIQNLLSQAKENFAKLKNTLLFTLANTLKGKTEAEIEATKILLQDFTSESATWLKQSLPLIESELILSQKDINVIQRLLKCIESNPDKTQEVIERTHGLNNYLVSHNEFGNKENRDIVNFSTFYDLVLDRPKEIVIRDSALNSDVRLRQTTVLSFLTFKEKPTQTNLESQFNSSPEIEYFITQNGEEVRVKVVIEYKGEIITTNSIYKNLGEMIGEKSGVHFIYGCNEKKQKKQNITETKEQSTNVRSTAFDNA